MIHCILGTRAQLVKMAPVIRAIERRDWSFQLIHTGQHKESMEALRRDFGIQTSWQLLNKGSEIKNKHQAIAWLAKLIVRIATNQVLLNQRLSNNDIILVHGDTFSTILGALIGKRLSIPVAHVEAGLRSFNLFNPFPEEINRLIAFRLSNIAFCPGQWALSNLKNYRKLKCVDTHHNTILDSLRFALKQKPVSNNIDNYGVISIHRFENIFIASRLRQIIKTLIAISQKYPFKLVFVLHPATYSRLEKQRLLHDLEFNDNIILKNRMGYVDFINLMAASQFVITDGGSNQEELHYLGIPTYLMRKTTERQEGLNDNIILGEYSSEKLARFLANLSQYSRPRKYLNISTSPSEMIVRHLEAYS